MSHQDDPQPAGVDRPRLLIADDDPVVRSVLSAQLDHDFEVIGAACDASEAVTTAHEHQPDVALIDVEMPEGGGLHAARGIRDGSPRTAIVVLSSDETDDMVRRLLDAGAMCYVRKGTSRAALVQTIRAAIQAHGALAAGPGLDVEALHR
jgi:DNA-binding NarL/FixJ family response regulator